jgi:2-polyprenyl-3-methyl-5-hydroxy-6-metoxy-1,4-benzoquinol methylase
MIDSLEAEYPTDHALRYRFADSIIVQRSQRHYVRLFLDRGVQAVLDVGCGRGLFGELLRDAGLRFRGIDASPEAIEECRKRGFHAVERVDALDFVAQQLAAGERFPGIFCSHLVEHLQAGPATGFLEGCARLLAPGGRLIVVTPNPQNPAVLGHHFWLDPTHVRPYPRPLLESILESSGLAIARTYCRVRFLGNLRFGLGGLRGMDSVVVADRSA